MVSCNALFRTTRSASDDPANHLIDAPRVYRQLRIFGRGVEKTLMRKCLRSVGHPAVSNATSCQVNSSNLRG
jgi:hypothetical protein